MKVKLTVLLALVIVCGRVPAFANATYTDRFDSIIGTGCCQVSPWGSGPPPIPLVQYEGSELVTGLSFATYVFPDYVQTFMQVDFSALLSTFHEKVDCDIAFPLCNYQWNGTFNGGNANIAATIVSSNLTFTHLTFTGTITGGTFGGEFDNYCGGIPCGPGYLDLRMNVSGTWSNGWRSSGLITLYADSDGPSGITTLTTATAVPEPGSFEILGSELTILACVLRRKLLH